MNLSRLVDRFATGTYTVTRTGAATSYTDGKRSAPSTSTFTAVASLQPMPGQELARLPEGLRDRDVRVFWTKVALQCGPGVEPDRVAVGSDTWQVEECKDWTGLGNYFRSVIRKAG